MGRKDDTAKRPGTCFPNSLSLNDLVYVKPGRTQYQQFPHIGGDFSHIKLSIKKDCIWAPFENPGWPRLHLNHFPTFNKLQALLAQELFSLRNNSGA